METEIVDMVAAKMLYTQIDEVIYIDVDFVI